MVVPKTARVGRRSGMPIFTIRTPWVADLGASIPFCVEVCPSSASNLTPSKRAWPR